MPRRFTDRVERAVSGFVGVGAVVVAVLAFVAALSLHGSGMAQVANDRVDRVQVDAVLTAPVEMPLSFDSTAGGSGSVPATWTGPTGGAHAGLIPVLGPRAAGDTVPVWVDRAGEIAPPPVDAVQARVTATVGGLLVALAGALVLLGIRAAVRARCAVVNHRAWEREWALHEPRWSGR
ncbi:Rv1733c family protein [Pseudonocardia xishanensis]